MHFKIGRIRETGPQVRKDLNVYRRSLSVGGDRLILTCSRSGDRELQGPVSRGRGDRGGQAPALRGRSISLATVGRGPVPRHHRSHRKRNSTPYIEKSPTKTLFTAPP